MSFKFFRKRNFKNFQKLKKNFFAVQVFKKKKKRSKSSNVFLKKEKKNQTKQKGKMETYSFELMELISKLGGS